VLRILHLSEGTLVVDDYSGGNALFQAGRAQEAGWWALTLNRPRWSKINQRQQK
jgi:hypothetical protein